MEADDLKLYSVIVGNGSGVLFQPMNYKYTYILTAKHNFLDKIHVEGRPDVDKEKADGTNIEIILLVLDAGVWSSQTIDFTIKRGENYFPHETADIAILKINYISGFEKLFGLNDYTINDDYYLCGFPDNKRDANIDNYPNQYTSHKISNKTSSINNLVEVRLNQQKTQDDITGMSGGGIFKLNDTCISIIGIQSQMTKAISLQNEIDFVPIKHFNEILSYPENENILMPLLPPYMARFDFLKNEIFKLEGCVNDGFIQAVRTKLQLVVDDVRLSPIEISNSSLKDQLLMSKEIKSAIYSKRLWTSWLEYLIVLHIVKQKIISDKDLSVIFNEIRLIHSETYKDWKRIMRDIFETDLYGLNEQGVLIVSTNFKPSTNIIEGKELINNIANANPGVSFKTDNAEIHPLKQFKFMHINAFEKSCIEDNEDELLNFTGIDIENLINKLKEIIDEIL